MVELNKEKGIEELFEDFFDAYHSGRGWSIARCGDSEWNFLNVDYANPGDAKSNVEGEFIFTRWDQIYIEWDSILPAQKLLVESFMESDWVGVLVKNDWAYTGTKAAFNKWNIPEPKNQVYWWISLYFAQFREFTDMLMGEPLFLMGEPMPDFSRILGETGHTLPRSLCSISTPRSIQDYNILCREIEDFGGKVILIALGIWGKPLALHAKRCGKLGIDFGNAAGRIGCNQYTMNTCCGYGKSGYLEHCNHAAGPACLWKEDGSRAKMIGEEYE